MTHFIPAWDFGEKFCDSQMELSREIAKDSHSYFLWLR